MRRKSMNISLLTGGHKDASTLGATPGEVQQQQQSSFLPWKRGQAGSIIAAAEASLPHTARSKDVGASNTSGINHSGGKKGGSMIVDPTNSANNGSLGNSSGPTLPPFLRVFGCRLDSLIKLQKRTQRGAGLAIPLAFKLCVDHTIRHGNNCLV